MAQRKTTHRVIIRSDQPIYLIPSVDGMTEEYIFSDDQADRVSTSAAIADALSLAGAWSELDWEAALTELDRIRHHSPPPPPIDEIT